MTTPTTGPTPSTPAASGPVKDGAASILSALTGTGGDSPAMPDLGGTTPATPKSKFKVHSQTLVIALVLVATGAALYTMRKQGMGSGVNFNPPKIEYELDKTRHSAGDFQQQQRVLSELARSQSPSQVQIENIQKNPFKLETASTVPQAQEGGADHSQDAAKAAAEQLRQRVLTTLASIDVGAIMAGNIPLARINGKIVREGEMVADMFLVKEIHDRSVDLEDANGGIHTVNMSENTGGGKPHPMPPRR